MTLPSTPSPNPDTATIAPSPNLYEQVFKLPKPQCCSHGDCCKGASPSVPVHTLWAKAAAGDAFARGFLSIFIPYASHEAARAVVPGLVERSLKAAAKNPAFTRGADDVVFYHCRYQQPDNRCGVYEDRPSFCRSYPDSPFVVMAPGCAFEGWGQACRQRYNAMQADMTQLRQLHDELKQLETAATHEGWGQRGLPTLTEATQQSLADDLRQANWPWVAVLCRFWLSSPL
jgi:Fe-S-cluster containining protein